MMQDCEKICAAFWPQINVKWPCNISFMWYNVQYKMQPEDCVNAFIVLFNLREQL